jgi:hypothetical protein
MKQRSVVRVGQDATTMRVYEPSSDRRGSGGDRSRKHAIDTHNISNIFFINIYSFFFNSIQNVISNAECRISERFYFVLNVFQNELEI